MQAARPALPSHPVRVKMAAAARRPLVVRSSWLSPDQAAMLTLMSAWTVGSVLGSLTVEVGKQWLEGRRTQLQERLRRETERANRQTERADEAEAQLEAALARIAQAEERLKAERALKAAWELKPEED